MAHKNGSTVAICCPRVLPVPRVEARVCKDAQQPQFPIPSHTEAVPPEVVQLVPCAWPMQLVQVPDPLQNPATPADVVHAVPAVWPLQVVHTPAPLQKPPRFVAVTHDVPAPWPEQVLLPLLDRGTHVLLLH